MPELSLPTTGSPKTYKAKKTPKRQKKDKRRRKISKLDVNLMTEIWRWKVLSYPVIKALVYKNNTRWTAYLWMRRLLNEGYLIERDALRFDVPLFQLSKKGFDLLKHVIGEQRENRFATQSAPHDYVASAFQIGDFIHGVPKNVNLFTEQEIQCTDDSLLPAWVPKTRDHIPDGLTRIQDGASESVVGIEVELNLKPMLKYDKTAYYYDSSMSKFDVVFWVCSTMWIAKEITDRLKTLRIRNHEIHHFILLDDFVKIGWDATARSGSERGKTIREIYRTRGVKEPYNNSKIVVQSGAPEIFFPTKKSPFGLKG